MLLPSLHGFLLLILLPALSTTSDPLITAARRLPPRQEPGEDSPSCSGWYHLESSCSAHTPNFRALLPSVQASCVCYTTSSIWAGSLYNAYLTSCLAYLSTASPSAWTQAGGPYITGIFTHPCDAFAPAVSSQLADCNTWEILLAQCADSTSSFSALPFSKQATCLCYESSSYAPSRFDGALAGCLAYYSTISPLYYSLTLSGDLVDRTPCAKAGNFEHGPTATAVATAVVATKSSSSSSSRPLTTTEPTSTGVGVNAAVTCRERRVASDVLVAMAIVVLVFYV